MELKVLGYAVLFIVILIAVVIYLARRSAFNQIEIESDKRELSDKETVDAIKEKVESLTVESAADELDRMRRRHSKHSR